MPQSPVPQTCSGILNETGMPSDIENITDIPPDFSWMTAMELYLTDFTIKKGRKLNFLGSDVSAISFPCMGRTNDITAGSTNSLHYWHYLPFAVGRYWTGSVKLRFMAIKPPRVTGKLIIRYYPDSTDLNLANNVFDKDTLFRGIKKEWDLGQSSDFEFDVPAFNVISHRPTWIPRFSPADWEFEVNPDGSGSSWYFWNLMPASIFMGMISISFAQDVQPGSIFPDSFRVLVFQSFKDFNSYVQCDPRSSWRHALDQGIPPFLSERSYVTR